MLQFIKTDMNIYSFISLFFFLLFLLPGFSCAELVDRNVAIVNNDIITLSELNELSSPMFKKATQEVPPEELEKVFQQIQKSVTNQLIEKKLMLQEAAKMKVAVSEVEIDRAVQRILDQNNINMAQLEEEFQQINITPAQYRENLKGQILRSKLVNVAIRTKVVITDEQTLEYYNKHHTQQPGADGYHILQIGVTWEQPSKSDKKLSQEEAFTEIQQIHSAAVQGKDFLQLAKQYSQLPSAEDGGDLGLFQEKEMAPFMREAVVGLAPGEISEIVATPAGYQFFSVLSHQQGGVVTKEPHESVKESIREKLYQEEMEKKYKEWINEIRDQAYIKIL